MFSQNHSTNFPETCTGRGRYGFNGKEKDDEWNGTIGADLDFGSRIYDSRIGRWFSIDPLFKAYPGWSPYVFALDNPIRYYDNGGMGPGDGTTKEYVTKVEVTNDKGVSETQYFAKYYYENVTPEQAQNYATFKGSKTGWFPVTAEEYNKFAGNEGHKNPQGTIVGKVEAEPEAFTHKVFGADTPEKENKIITKDSHSDFFETEKPAGSLHIEATLNPGPTASSASFSYGTADASGNETVLGTATVTATSPVNITVPYSYPAGGSLFVTPMVGSPGTKAVGATTPEKKGNRAPDTMSKYGTEEPTKGVDY